MRDFTGDYAVWEQWQRRLDAAGVDFDVTSVSGATYREIENTVNYLLERRLRLRSETQKLAAAEDVEDSDLPF